MIHESITFVDCYCVFVIGSTFTIRKVTRLQKKCAFSTKMTKQQADACCFYLYQKFIHSNQLSRIS